MVQISHLYMTTGKTIALTMQTFVGKVTSLLLNMLFMFIIGSFTTRISKSIFSGVKMVIFTSRQIDWDEKETVADFIFLGFKITVDGDCSHEI